MVDVRRLRVLCEVSRHGSFSAAAAALGYTQPAVSRQIAILEAETGTTLVRRVPQGAVLTDAGRLLVDRGEAVLAQLTDLELELQALAGLQGGRLRLASFASAAASIVPPALAMFRERHPAVELQVVMADPVDSVPRLRGGELDFALSHDRRLGAAGGAGDAMIAGDGSSRSNGTAAARDAAASSLGVELVHLFDDPMYVALPNDHRLAEAATLSLGDLAEEPWMLATPNSCPDSRLFLRACHGAGFEPRIVLQNDDYRAILGLVAARVGVAMIPEMVTRGVAEHVVIRMLDPPAPARPILAVLPAGYRSPAAAAMLDVLLEVGARWVAERPVVAMA
jgi:DNA-binding transcriptional LysR family regulator